MKDEASNSMEEYMIPFGTISLLQLVVLNKNTFLKRMLGHIPMFAQQRHG
jgi:hypothetical protein